MKKIKAVWELLRLEHGIMIFIAILIGSFIAGKSLPSLDKFVFTFFTALFLEASTFALNDYYDLEIDKKNNRMDRPLVREDLSEKSALILFWILFPLGLISSFFVNYTCFIIAIITAIFAILYDVILKKYKLVGNFFIAYTMSIPFVFGGVAVIQENILELNIQPEILTIALIAFFAGAGREVLKDVMDYKGDKERGVKSFPKYIGIYGSKLLAAILIIIAVGLSLIPFFIKSFETYFINMYYLFIVIIADTMLLSTSLQLIFIKKTNIKYHRKFTLVALFFGLIAFLVGAFKW
jgi:geranylgeranylglycerol-phosphate geranylgeranyltransferase